MTKRDTPNRCEFCNEEKKETESTTIVGWYCVECHRIVIEESRDAIKRIRERIKKGR